jgi:hypothetical protein
MMGASAVRRGNGTGPPTIPREMEEAIRAALSQPAAAQIRGRCLDGPAYQQARGMTGRWLAHSVNYLAKHRKTIQPVRTTKLIKSGPKKSAGSFGVSKAHIGIMGDRLLAVGAVR